LHYAAFFGNFNIINLLLDNGANVFAVNSSGINMMHVAAQGDQPFSLAFFYNRKLHINSQDF
jgi:palmitoyltransferase